jgi:hypothetical protein
MLIKYGYRRHTAVGCVHTHIISSTRSNLSITISSRTQDDRPIEVRCISTFQCQWFSFHVWQHCQARKPCSNKLTRPTHMGKTMVIENGLNYFNLYLFYKLDQQHFAPLQCTLYILLRFHSISLWWLPTVFASSCKSIFSLLRDILGYYIFFSDTFVWKNVEKVQTICSRVRPPLFQNKAFHCYYWDEILPRKKNKKSGFWTWKPPKPVCKW